MVLSVATSRRCSLIFEIELDARSVISPPGRVVLLQNSLMKAAEAGPRMRSGSSRAGRTCSASACSVALTMHGQRGCGDYSGDVCHARAVEVAALVHHLAQQESWLLF